MNLLEPTTCIGHNRELHDTLAETAPEAQGRLCHHRSNVRNFRLGREAEAGEQDSEGDTDHTSVAGATLPRADK